MSYFKLMASYLIPSVTFAAPVISLEKPLNVRYAKSQTVNPLYKKQTEYFYEILALGLEKSTKPYQLEMATIPTNVEQSRSLKLLENGYYDVHWYTTDANRENTMLPIRIPLTKGLIGLRLMFIHQDTPDIFKHISSTEQLKTYIGGQGRNWPDTILLKQQKFHIEEATNSVALLKMLDKKRIEYFPRSMLEIWHEITVIKDMKIAIDQHIALQYPLAVYFFVAQDNQKLHDLLELGLKNAIADGSFNKVFYKYYGDYVTKSRLKKRKILKISNPNMTPETPLNIPELWFSQSN
jgi:hypothetical protein